MEYNEFKDALIASSHTADNLINIEMYLNGKYLNPEVYTLRVSDNSGIIAYQGKYLEWVMPWDTMDRYAKEGKVKVRKNKDSSYMLKIKNAWHRLVFYKPAPLDYA